MILDTLSACHHYTACHPGFAAAFEFLRRPDLASLDVGRHVLDGDRLLALVGRDAARSRESSPLEAHRRYIDVQYVVAGDEVMGWKALRDCQMSREGYQTGRDIEFFADAPDFWFPVRPGSFAIFFPHDAHAPLAGSGIVHKVVMKVAVAWA